jgi:hypothetical protein
MSLRTLLAFSLCLAVSPALADDKWEVTTSIEMTGMPFQVPPQTQTVCLPPGQQNNEKMVPADKNCKVSSFATTGSTSRFRIECASPQQMTGEGEITRIGTDAYKGSLKAKGNMHGQAFDMKIGYAGRKIGSCPASENVQNKAKTAVVQQQAQVGQACQQVAASMTWQVADSMSVACPALKADICKAAKAELSKVGSDPEALRNLQAQRSDWRELAGYCGVDAAAIESKSCTVAKAKRNWAAVAQFCGSEAEALAAQHCPGSPSSAGMSSEYGPLCERFADKVQVAGANNAATGSGDSAAKLNQAIDGINKLRGLFKK